MKKTLIALAAVMLLAGCGNGRQQDGCCDAQEAVINNIMSRKSVRSFTGQKITEAQIETLMKAAMAAPSAINIQPWHFVVITDDSLLSSIYAGDPQAEMFTSAGTVIIVCGQTKNIRRNPDGEESERENPFWFEDCAAATENLLLAAESMGLGAVWTAAYPMEGRMNRYVEALGLPEGVLPFCAVPVGYPSGNDQPKDKWKPEKIHRNRW